MFLENTSLYYINLDREKTRDKYIKKSFESLGIAKYTRISAKTPLDVPEPAKRQGKSFGITDNEIATSYSHLYAIKNFLENSLDEYAVICEDDADLENIKKIDFSVNDLFKTIFPGYGCFQLAVLTRIELKIDFKAHCRTPWDFSTACYAITKDHAKHLVDKYFYKDNFSFDNFITEKIFEYRNNNFVGSTPVAEFVIYEPELSLSIPIFSAKVFNSSVQYKEENHLQALKSKKLFDRHWAKFSKISAEDLQFASNL